MAKQILSVIKIITLSFVFLFGLSYVYAWTGPTVSAPGGNVSGPINTSGTAQTKTGNLTLGKLCLSGICNASWPAAAGDNLGNHTATQGLNMSNYSIANVGSFFHTSGNYFYLPGPYSPYKGASTAGDGKVLTSDAAGYASWQTPATGGVSSFNGATGAVTGVSSITAGTGITVSPATGAVTVSATAPAVHSTRVVTNSVIVYRWPTTSVQCASNEVVVGGGGSCTDISPDNTGANFLYRSFPLDNGWQINCDTSNLHNVRGTVYAICLAK